MYQARRAAAPDVSPDVSADVPADAAVAAAFRSAPRRGAVSPFAAIASRVLPTYLSVALVVTAGAIAVGARANIDAQAGVQSAESLAAPLRAEALSRGGTRALEGEKTPEAHASSAPVAAAWSAQFGVVVATWYAQSEVALRSSATPDAPALATLKAGDKVEITEHVVDGFREVVHGRQVAWVPDAEVGEDAPLPGAVAKSPGKTSDTRVLGLTVQAMGVYNAVMGQWGGEINSVGGYRSSSLSDHQFGRAIDFMLTPGTESALGWTVARWLAAHAGELGVDHIIFEQKIWTPNNPTWRPMADRGGITANHFDHVHVSVES